MCQGAVPLTQLRRAVVPLRCRALTLIELCAGIVALAGLLAAVVPALRSARNADLTAQCRENLGRIQQAALVYAAEDPGEQMIPIGIGDTTTEIYPSYYDYGGKSGWWKTNVLTAYQSPFAGTFPYRMGPNDRPLNRIMFKAPFPPPPIVSSRAGPAEDYSFDMRWDVEVYDCPADAGFSGMHHKGWKDSQLSSYDAYGTSYAATAVLVGSPFSGAPLSSNSIYLRPASAIPVPAETVSYLENAGHFAMLANNPALGQTGGCWPRPEGNMVAHGWHGEDFHFNVAFADGGVAWREIRGFGRNPAAGCFPGGTCDCIRVRAPGWRMDTLPVAITPTWKLRVADGEPLSTQDGASTTWNVTQ